MNDISGRLTYIQMKLSAAIDIRDEQMYQQAWEEFTLYLDELFEWRLTKPSPDPSAVRVLPLDQIWRPE